MTAWPLLCCVGWACAAVRGRIAASMMNQDAGTRGTWTGRRHSRPMNGRVHTDGGRFTVRFTPDVVD